MTDGWTLPALAMRSVLAGGRIGGRGGVAVHTALSSLWLGLLSDEQLRALDEHYYLADPTYRTAVWNARGLWDWERDAVEAAFPAGSRIVVPGCGGGREVLALLRAGYDAVGYESHPKLVAFAGAFLAERGHPARVHAASRDRFPDAGRCDGVLVGWGTFSLIAQRERRVAFLRDAAAATAPAGAVVLSAFARAAHGRELRVTAGAARALRALRGAVPVELGDTLAPNRVHVFTRDQAESELRAAGLELVAWRLVGRCDERTEYACMIGRSR